MAPHYERTTVATDLDDLPTDMRAALGAYGLAHQLSLDDALPAWSTRSVNPPSTTMMGKLFRRRANPTDPDSEHQTVVIVHPSHVIVVISGSERGVTVLSTPLAIASITDGPTIGGVGSGETGFTITGLPGDAGWPGSFYVGLGPEPAGRDCAEAVRAAVVAAKNR
ncbi:hypothetical protein QSJ19_09340 [Gordonia sp. ABSL11-1]|uniref:hypothetical protein n=1 Tax=Gordonia sp. ABSL11-1 TaxID=3053924 RepID=UPI002573672A|nr:hypothetical protein [Gordonia sp. ABSL11-1]MDL9945788.1 hypothetical protein [Gordonia sp. ABSL11-1]